MPSNDSSGFVHYLAGRFPGKIGWLMSPSSWKRPRSYLPYACDNDAYMSFVDKREWDEKAWVEMLQKAKLSGKKPLWILIPDVVADRLATLSHWEKYSQVAASFNWPMAFAVQDGMTPDDVPEKAEVIFIGGTTSWKWRSLPMWTKHFKRVHVGRVNSIHKLWSCEDHGVESVDGTGWFRGTDEGDEAQGLLRWISGERNETEFFPEFEGLLN